MSTITAVLGFSGDQWVIVALITVAGACVTEAIRWVRSQRGEDGVARDIGLVSETPRRSAWSQEQCFLAARQSRFALENWLRANPGKGVGHPSAKALLWAHIVDVRRCCAGYEEESTYLFALESLARSGGKQRELPEWEE